MAFVALVGASQVLLEAIFDMSGSTSLALTIGTDHGSMTRPKFVTIAQHKHDKKEINRRAVLILVTSGLASGSFVGMMVADAKPIKVGPPPYTSSKLLYPTSVRHGLISDHICWSLPSLHNYYFGETILGFHIY